MFERLGHEEGRATLLTNLGKRSREAGDLETSLKRYEQALVAAQQVGARRLAAMALHGIAVARDLAGEPDEALGAYARALAEAEVCPVT